jgi:hypothetical protein
MGETYILEPGGEGLAIRRERDGAGASPEIQRRIREAVSATDYFDLQAEPHRFYMVEAFHPTRLRKRAAPGVMGLRYLSAEKLGVPGAPPAADLADQLAGRHFD